MKKKIASGAALAAALLLVYIVGLWYPLSRVKATEPENTTSKFDVSVLETWCGEPVGTIRMVGGWYYEPNTLEDETGNLWGFDGIEDEAFYLVWIDDMGTPEIEDDEILKIWKEF